MSSQQIPVSIFQTPDVWPPGNCTETLYGAPVLPNTTDSRVCAMQSTNRTLAAACCGDADLQEYQCFLYCRYDRTGNFWQQCYEEQLGLNATSSLGPSSLFCQGNLTAENKESLTSSGLRQYTTPRSSWMIFALLFAFFFASPISATIIPSLDNGKTLALARRANDDSQCTFVPQQNYTRAGQQVKVSANYVRTSGFGTQVDSGINNNNRTINRNSAADPQYDQFFEIVSNVTGRLFPAQSSVATFHEALGLSGTTFLTFIPIQLCFNGTATNCDGVLGDSNNSTTVEACGPVFVGDVQSLNDTNAIIQGQWWIVQS